MAGREEQKEDAVRGLLFALLLAGCRTMDPGDDPRLAGLLGSETELEVSPACMAVLDVHPTSAQLAAQGGDRLYKLTVECSPGYDFGGTRFLDGDLCETEGPPYVEPVLEALCDSDGPVTNELVILLTANQWNGLVRALVDRGLAGGER